MQQARGVLRALGTPSLLSGMIIIVAVMVWITSALYILFYKGTELDTYTRLTLSQPSEFHDAVEYVIDDINTSRQWGDAAVFALWSGIGMLGYVLVVTIRHIVGAGEEVVDDLVVSTPHQRHIIIDQIGSIVMVRLAGIVGLGAMYTVVRWGIPYIVVWIGQVHLSDMKWDDGLLIIALSGVLATVLHICVICVRLIVLRTRVFW